MKNRYELIVVGGGFAGVAAAISAARRGVDTLLIERFNCLGGAAANGLVMPFMSYWTNDSVTGKRKFLCGGLFREIVSEMQARSGSENLMEFDEELEFRIVGSTEASSLQGKISNESPVGKALLRHKVGDVVEVETQAGTVEYKVLEIQKSN